jgi:hypothetical protein
VFGLSYSYYKTKAKYTFHKSQGEREKEKGRKWKTGIMERWKTGMGKMGKMGFPSFQFSIYLK